MQGLLAGPNTIWNMRPENIAKQSYKLADAMLKARESNK